MTTSKHQTCCRIVSPGITSGCLASLWLISQSETFFKTILTQTSSWTVSKELSHPSFLQYWPHISQLSVFRDWESVCQSKWMKAYTFSFLQNSLWLHNPLPRCSEGMGAARGSWTHFLPAQEGRPGFPAQAFSLLISKLSQALTRCDPFPSTSGTLDATAPHSFLPLCSLMW